MPQTSTWSRTAGLAAAMLKHIKILLMTPLLMELFPEIIPAREKWEKDTRDELTTARLEDYGDVVQENQVEVWGIEGTVTGRHYDYHFYDDIINQQSVTTSDQLAKVEIWWEHVQAIRELSAVEKMIGTRYHERDIYGLVIKEKFFPIVSIHQIVVNGKPFYKFFTMKDIARMKRRMKDAFGPQMMNQPVMPHNRIFSAPYPHYPDLPDDPQWYMAVDPSLGKKYSNKQGIVIGCVSRSVHDKVYIKEAFGALLRSEELATLIVAKIAQYRPGRVGIEYGLMESLQYIIDAKLSEWENANGEVIRPLFWPLSIGNTKKSNKIANTIGAFIRDNRALLGPNCQELEIQMDMFNPNSEDNDDDVIDAAHLLIRTIEYFAQSKWFGPPGTEKLQEYNLTMEMIYKGMNKKPSWSEGLVNVS